MWTVYGVFLYFCLKWKSFFYVVSFSLLSFRGGESNFFDLAEYYNVTRFSIDNVRTTGVVELTKRKIGKLLLVSVLERMHTKLEAWSLNNSMVYNLIFKEGQSNILKNVTDGEACSYVTR